MRKRVIKDLAGLIEQIANHELWEIEPLLPPDIFSQIREVGKSILFRKGHYLLCPFHQEKTPSCWYTPDNRVIYCFGCGTYCENLIYFYMKVGKKKFFPAIIRLAKFFKIKIEWENIILKGEDVQIEKYRRQINSYH